MLKKYIPLGLSLIAVLVLPFCSPADPGAEDIPDEREPRSIGTGEFDEREPRTIGSDAALVKGVVALPASLVYTSAAGIRVFVDGNDAVETTTDANGYFEIIVPKLLPSEEYDGNSAGIIAETVFGGQRHGFRKQIDDLKFGKERDAGVINAYRFGMISGHVSVFDDGNTVAKPGNIDVFISGTQFKTTADADGNFSLDLPMGDWQVVAILDIDGYTQARRKFRVRAGHNRVHANLSLFADDAIFGRGEVENGTVITNDRTVGFNLSYTSKVKGMRISEIPGEGTWKPILEHIEHTFLNDSNGEMTLYVSLSDRVGDGGTESDTFALTVFYKPSLYTQRVVYNTIDADTNVPYKQASQFFSGVPEQFKVAVDWHPVAVAIGDFNQDTYPDIVVVNDNAKPNYVYLNSKQGFTFEPRVLPGDASLHASSVATGDFNRDGFPDIVVGYHDAWPQVFYGSAGADFSRVSVLKSPQAQQHAGNLVTADDIDGTGADEVIVSYAGTTLLPEYHQFAIDGNITSIPFADEPYLAEAITTAWSAKRRIKKDIVFGNSNLKVRHYKFKNGLSYVMTIEKFVVHDLAAADFDGDGNPDAVAAFIDAEDDPEGGVDNIIHMININSALIPYPAFAHGEFVFVADINDDGFDDVLSSGKKERLLLSLSNQKRKLFSPLTIDRTLAATVDIAVADFNRDGYLDVVELFESTEGDANALQDQQTFRIFVGQSPEI